MPKTRRIGPREVTLWHICAALILAPGSWAQAQAEAPSNEEAGAETPAEEPTAEEPPAVEETATAEAATEEPEVVEAEVEEAPGLASELEAPTQVAPASQPLAAAAEAPPEHPVEQPEAEPRGIYWRLPRERVSRPLTLPQGVMHTTSTVSIVRVPLSTSPTVPFGGASTRTTGFFGAGVGILDDWEIGTNLLGITMLPGINLYDPSLYTRVRVLSGEVQIGVRGELTAPVTSQSSAWMGLAVDLAWTPVSFFRFEAAVDYGLHYTNPLQQTIYVPLRALFQAGPNTFGLHSGLVVYNDGDDYDVPAVVSWSVSWRGLYQGPLADMRIEGGVADVSDAERSWLIRGVWTFFAYL